MFLVTELTPHVLRHKQYNVQAFTINCQVLQEQCEPTCRSTWAAAVIRDDSVRGFLLLTPKT